jgi:hypothetical protein
VTRQIRPVRIGELRQRVILPAHQAIGIVVQRFENQVRVGRDRQRYPKFGFARSYSLGATGCRKVQNSHPYVSILLSELFQDAR